MITIRNKIELNGVSSEAIQGLLIQSLPPISKPMIRTAIEEIDGRDGDIVTELGYSAYNKQFDIGLYGDFAIDDVIEFFNSQGTVTFSNEPDKYYYYQIIGQIDFERLIRFKTATVTLHVQPFKFGLNELAKTFNINSNLLTVPNYTSTKNDITLTASDGVITVSGTGSAVTEFYVPISALGLEPGSYTLTATTTGTGTAAASIRMIGSVPSDADTFGGTYTSLATSPATISDTIEAETTYNYLWFYITAGTAMDFTLITTVESATPTPITIRNNGNIYSRPTMTIFGTGTINLSLNGTQLFVIELDESHPYITIDTTAMEAYQDTTDNLMNRYVDGDYDNFKLNVGGNTISWTGNLTQIIITNYSRWI